MATVSPPPASGDPEQLQAVPSEGYAAEVLAAYEASPESPRSFTGRSIEFLSNSAGKMWGTFKEADLIGKGAMVAAGAATAYVGIKVIEAGISLFRRTWDKVTHLGDTLESGLTGLRDMTKEKLLIALLSVGAVGGLLYGLVRLDWDEIWAEAQQHDGSFMVGFLSATVERIVSGAIGLPGEWWDDLAEKFDFLPSRAELTELRDKGKEVVAGARQGAAEVRENVREGVSEAVDWMAEFSEKSGLNELSTRVTSFFGSEMVFDGWESDSILAPLRTLKEDPAQIASYLGVTDTESLRSFLAASGGVATGTYLLTRLMGSPWGRSLKMAGLNVGLYMFFKSEGVEDRLVKGIDWLHGVEMKLHDETTKVLKHLGIVKPEAIGLSVGSFQLQDAMNLIFKMAKDYPAISVLAVIDAAYLTRHAILAVVAACFKALVSGVMGVADFALEHPLVAASGGGIAALTILERRHVIKELSEKLYPSDDQAAERRQFIEDMRGYLDAIPFVDLSVSEDPTLSEAAWKPIYEQIVADPIQWFSDPERRFRFRGLFQDGFFSLNRDAFGNWFLTAGLVFSPLLQGVRLEKNIVESIFDEWDQRGFEPANLNVYATYAGEICITTAAIVGTFRGYRSLLAGYNGKSGSAPRLLQGIFNPRSPEYRHVLRSMVRESADWASGLNASRMKHAFQLRDFSIESKGFFDIADRMVALDKESPNYSEEFGKLKKELGLQLGNVDRKFPVRDSLILSQDRSFLSALGNIRDEMRSRIYESLVKGELPTDAVADLKTRLAQLQTKTRWFDLVSRGKQIFDPTGTLGRFHEFADTSRFKVPDFKTLVDHLSESPVGEPTEARSARLSELGRVSMEFEARFPAEFQVHANMPPGEFLNPLPEFQNSHLKAYADELRARGVSLEALQQMDQIKGLDKANIEGLIEAIKKDPLITAKANEVLYDIRYKRQLGLIKKYCLYEGMSLIVAILIVYEFEHSTNKSEFYSHLSTGLGGFSVGIATVRAVEHWTNKFPPWLRFTADLTAGTLGAMGLSAIVGDFLSSKIYVNHPNIDVEGSRLGEDLLHEFGAAGDAFVAAGMGRGLFDGVTEHTHPIDYLSHTIRTFKPIGEKDYFKGSMRKDYYHRFDDDLAHNAEERIDRYRRKIERKKEKLATVDVSTEKAMKLERDIEQLGQAIVKLTTFVDGSWVRDVREELSQQSDAVDVLTTLYMDIANKKFPEPDNRGASVVHTMVGRIGIGQDIIDPEDMDVWHYLYRHRPVELPNGQTIDFRGFVIFASTVKRRKKQMEELSYDLAVPEEPATPDDPAAPEEPDISEEAATPQSLAA